MAITNYEAKQLNNSNEAMQRAQVGTLLQAMEAELALIDPATITSLGELAGELSDDVEDLTDAVSALAMTKASHTVVADDVGEVNTVVELAFAGTPESAVIMAITNDGVAVTGFAVAYAENAVTVSIAKESLPIGSKVSAIIW